MGFIPCCTNIGTNEESLLEANQQVKSKNFLLFIYRDCLQI